MSLLLIGNTVSEDEDVNPTTEFAAVCLKRVAEAQFLCLGHNEDHLVLSRIVKTSKFEMGSEC